MANLVLWVDWFRRSQFTTILLICIGCCCIIAYKPFKFALRLISTMYSSHLLLNKPVDLLIPVPACRDLLLAPWSSMLALKSDGDELTLLFKRCIHYQLWSFSSSHREHSALRSRKLVPVLWHPQGGQCLYDGHSGIWIHNPPQSHASGCQIRARAQS